MCSVMFQVVFYLSMTTIKYYIRPVVYFPKKYLPTESDYEIYDKELMAIVRAFGKWRPKLEESTSPINIILDH